MNVNTKLLAIFVSLCVLEALRVTVDAGKDSSDETTERSEKKNGSSKYKEAKSKKYLKRHCKVIILLVLLA